MKLDLEVLASTTIQRRKPWPKILWIGEEQESLLLLDPPGHRTSVLYVPSGKTKRKLPKLSALVEQTLCYSCTKNGRYLLGVLQSGELFVWHKDKDVVKLIPGLSRQTKNYQAVPCNIMASDDCAHVFVAVGTSLFYLWEMEKGESISKERDAELKGNWHKVITPNGMELPNTESKECSLAGVFYTSPVLGTCCQFSIIYNSIAMLRIITLLLKFPDPVESFGKSLPIYSAEWSLLEYPFEQMHPNFESVCTTGAYVSSYCGNGQVLAVAANQRCPTQTVMLFVSPLTDTVLVAGMKGCGVSDPNKSGRHYWVCDLSWTSDSLFLACILKNGSVCVMSRLGEPIIIQTEGCSVSMGPSHFLPLHPAIFVSDNQGSLEPSAAEQDPMRQHFSLATHPSLPIILFSDGFLVTVVQLPVDVNSASMMKNFVLESSRFLKKVYEQENLDMTVADAYKLSKGQRGSKQVQDKEKMKKMFEFELAEISLNSTHESEVSMIDTTGKFGFDQFGAIGNMDAGKIVFGEPEMISIDPNATFSGLDASEALLKYLEEAMTALVLSWKLAATYPDMWTAEVDNIAKLTVHNLCKIFSIVLDCPAVEAIIPVLTPRQNSAIQNPRVYNIIVAYRNILQLLRFDKFNQHLIPAALGLVYKTITLMLTSKELESTDPRLKTLFGCYSLLKHAEASLNKIYDLSSIQSQNSSPSSSGQNRFLSTLMEKFGKQSTTGSVSGQQEHLMPLPGRRLAKTWKLLYRHLAEYQSQLLNSGDQGGELQHLEKLMATIQQTLQESDSDVTPRKTSPQLSIGDKLSVDGEHTLAVEAWKEQLRAVAGAKDSPKIAKMLHAILYTHLMKGELGQAVDFIDSLIMQASVAMATSGEEFPVYDDGSRPALMTLVSHRSQDSNEEEFVPCIKNKSIRQTVQTMARFMAAYFSNEPMFIFPPHSAQALPSVHMSSQPTKSRIIPKYHEDITNIIRRDNLSGVWTTERTVEYLLLSGLICEMAWFASRMGDWKTAYMLSVAHVSHRDMAPFLYKKPKKPLQLPEGLSPQAVIQEKLQILIQSNTADSAAVGKGKRHKRYFIPINQETNIPQLSLTLQDVFLAGIICQVELAPWFLSSLVEKLKSVVAGLPSLVPDDFYLPSPPLYCPQPGEIEMTTERPDVEYEKELRLEISSIIQLIMVAFNSAHLSLPVARWYIQELFKVQERAAQFKSNTEGPCLELPEVLQQYKILRSSVVDFKDDPHVHEVLCSFRDFCTVLWLLHVRDKLSMQLRKRGNQLHNEKTEGQDSAESTLAQSWVQECFKTLKWAVQLLTFSQYITDDGCIHKVLLSLIHELPPTEDIADILAEHFYMADSLDPEVQEKLERVLSNWTSIEIHPEDDGKSARLEEPQNEGDMNDVDEGDDVRKSVTFYDASPRSKTLSVYYHKQCDVVQKVLKKKRKCFGDYEEFVFSSQQTEENSIRNGGSIFVGSRPFETKQSYLEFLDRFYAISFTRLVEQESEQRGNPIYPSLMPFSKLIRDAEFEVFLKKNEETFQKKPSSIVLSSPRAKFIRSQSESHVQNAAEPDTVVSANHKNRGLFRSSSSGDVQPPRGSNLLKYRSEGSLMVRNSPRNRTQRPGMSPTKATPNMTGMASRFFQSEDVLYRELSESQEAHWILDVNFGESYLYLQQLLDWLHHWCCKQHSLGLHGKNEKDTALKPTMRIEVPTQLVILSLWLLEHKYSKSKKRKDCQAQIEVKEKNFDVVEENLNFADDRPKLLKQKALATVEELTEHDSLTQVSNIAPRSRSHSPYQSRTKSPGNHRSRSHSPAADSREATLEYYRSITSTMEETEQIHSAYKKVLNDRHKKIDESSSLEVSSLDPDDYGDDMKQTLSMIGSEHQSRSRTPKKKARSGRRKEENSPETRNSSTLNHTLHFEVSPERANTTQNAPQTSTPLRNSRHENRNEIQADISHISLPPSGQPGLYTAPPRGANNTAPPRGQMGYNTAPPDHYRGGLLGGDPGHTVPGVPSQQVSAPLGSQAGLDLGQQLQQIIRGELRRMLEVQHQSMLAMMGALDGQVPQIPVAWQPDQSANQRQAYPSSRSLSPPRRGQQEEIRSERQKSPKGKIPFRGVLSELHNLQITERKEGKRRKSRSPGATLSEKENLARSALHMSELRDPSHQQEDIQLYRVENGDPSSINFAPRFLRIPAERDTDVPLRFPHIPSQAWGPRQEIRDKENILDMPLLHVDRTVPGQMFPGSQRSRSLPKYIPQQGYFQPPQGPAYPPAPVRHREGMESPDSGIGMPLLHIPKEDEHTGRRPRFGELLPPDVVIENEFERQKKEFLREKYAREFHEQHARQADERDRQRFGENLLHFDFKTEEEAKIEKQVKQMMKKQKSLRKGHEPVSEEVSKNWSARSKSPDSARSKSKSLSHKSKTKSESHKSKTKSVHDKEDEEEAEPGEGLESTEEEEEPEDETEAESMEEDQEAELNDGYAFRQGEFEAYLALEKQLAETKDTNARIQLMTALKLQQRRMVENWKRPSRRPRVDFATMTREHVDAEMATDIAMETESIRTAEKYTSITKDTGVDPIQEAVIEYNKSRQPAVLPPDIYMGLRFADASRQPSSDVTGQQEPGRGRAYLNVVDLDASAILKDLHEKPERDIESRLDTSVPATQAHLRDRMAQESGLRDSLEPVIERPTRADLLTVKMFETRARGEDRLSVAVMPRDSMPESKAAIMSRLRDMNQQLAAIDRMSNNIEREFKSTRLAINTLEDMTSAMEPPTKERQDAILEEDVGPSPSGSRSLTPQLSAKSPTISARATARSARSKKSAVSVEDKQILSTELAKMSGLSGISDIIGDMVARGEIDLEEAGLTEREAEHLFRRGAIRHEEIEEVKVSLDEIKKMHKTVSRAPDFSRENLHEWMAARRHKQMAEYKKHLEELREREPKPFKQKPGILDHSLTTKELQESEQARQDHRKLNTRAFMAKRLKEAQNLLGNILTDKPDLPKETPTSAEKHKLKRKDTSPAAKERKGKPYAKEYSASAKQVSGILKIRDTSPGKAWDYSPPSFRSLQQPHYPLYHEDMLNEEQIPSPREAEPAPDRVHKVTVAPVPEIPKRVAVKPHPGVPRLKLSLEDVDEEPRLQQTVETTGDLSEYARAMEAMDDSQEPPKVVARQPEVEPEKQVSPVKPYKAKPYTEMVRVQRPEITRKKPAKVDGDATYVGRLQSVSQSEAGTARTETTQREREMIYGSKRLPVKKPTETGPRRVKTYSERLQEMKSDKKFSTPVAPRSQYGSSIASSRDMRSVTRVIKPKHKPMTYVEQLQKLNEGTHKPRMGQTTVIQKTMVKSHKPSHKPKTYAQQLQELQPQKPMSGPPSRRTYKPPPGRAISRQRPYKDPYAPLSHADYDQWERESVVSAWSVGDDVRHILYDDVESSIAVGQSASYAPSEQISDYYDVVMGDDYTASVDIDELVKIADNGSDVSGSLISKIDWDEVEDLIADVS